jgi:hypothetical protein
MRIVVAGAKFLVTLPSFFRVMKPGATSAYA